MNPARFCAYRSLVKFIKNASYSNLELDATLRQEELSPADRNLYGILFLGVLEKKITLDYLLSQLCKTPLNKLSPEVLAILEMGAYQILYLDRIPDRAAIFEAGEIAKKECRASLSLINAVLRRFSAEKDTLPKLLALPGKKGLALRYGYPKFLVSLWQEAYGKERCLSILEEQNKRPPLTLRVNTLKITLSDYEALLKEKSIPFHRNPLCRFGLTLEKNVSPTLLPGFEEGLFFVQDAAAQHAVDRLEAKPGHRVLDLCAAPGGKSFGAGMDMGGVGSILSLELHESRLDLIQSGAKRLGLTVLCAKEADSSKINPLWRESFDRVICDVPCSGYGVIAKKPDIRHKDKNEATALLSVQRDILEHGAEALKKGGVLIYSTCTLNPEENERITDEFLARHPEFTRNGNAETIFPIGGENDGFFCDRLEKRND